MLLSLKVNFIGISFMKIVLGNKTLEVRPSSIDKATAARAIYKDLGGDSGMIDFLLCVGDGRTDEVVFSMFQENSFALTATVGKKQTEAKYFVETVQDVEALLEGLVGLQQ